MYIVTLRHIHATNVAAEKQYHIVWVWICSLRYPACNAYVPQCHLWPVWLYNIFPHYLINGTILWGGGGGWVELLHIKCVFWFSLQLLSETFLSLRSGWDMIKNVYWSLWKVPIILVRFKWNLNFLNRFSKNTQISNFLKFYPVGAGFFHVYRWMDRHDFAILWTCLKNGVKWSSYELKTTRVLKKRYLERTQIVVGKAW